MNPNLKDIVGTGSKWRDALIGGVTGLGEALNGGDGNYYVNAQWQGNGLAKTGLGYAQNPNRRDYTSGGIGLADVFRRRKQQQQANQQDGDTSIKRYIDNYARPTQYDMYSDNYGIMDNNYSTPISSAVTDMLNAEASGTPYSGEFGSIGGSLGDYIYGSSNSWLPATIF